MDDKLAITLLELLSQNPNCQSSLSMVCSKLRTRGILGQLNMSELKKQLQNFRTVFSISEGPFQIPDLRIDVHISLCDEHNNMKAQCSKYSCEHLHICKYFLLSNSCTRRGCMYGHNLDTPHNRKALRPYWMDQLHVEHIRNIFRCIRNRTFQTTPQICRFFQNNSCDESQRKCSRIHLCPNFVSGSCTRGPACHGHNVFDTRVTSNLERYGIDMKRPEEEILDDLRSLDLSPSPLLRYRSEPALAPRAQPRNTRGTSRRRDASATRRGRFDECRGGSGNIGIVPLPPQRPHSSHAPPPLYPSPSNYPNNVYAHQGVGPPSQVQPYRFQEGRILPAGHENRYNLPASNQIFSGPPYQHDNHGYMNTHHHPGQPVSHGEPHSRNVPSKQPIQPLQKDTDEICMKHFKRCPQKGKCDKHHKKRSYQWQYQVKEEDATKTEMWNDFNESTNIQLEKTFADPQESQCLVAYRMGDIVTINFKDMAGCSTQTQLNVRRLSTPSSDSTQIDQERYKWSTLWRWFWEDEDGVWIEYNEMESTRIRQQIERAFTDNPRGQLQLQIGSNSYDLQFDSMTQTNVITSTKRHIRRRPRFFTEAEIETRIDPRLLKPLCPTEWSMTYTDKDELMKHYKKEMVTETSDEYLRVDSLFKRTLPPGKVMVSLERIENGELWIRFDAQREHMKRKAGKKVAERQLFHGTTDATTEAICRQGFEFRYSGDRVGSRYGRGSYFARDAKYSDCYTERNTDTKKMFVAQVLVGDFTRGTRDDKRPPPKSTHDPHELYDSCVDDESDPEIFVIFSLDQVYPQYLITYVDSTLVC